jgi:hypothetical protein
MAAQYNNEIVEDELDQSLESEFACTLRLRGPKSNSTSIAGSSAKPPLFGGVGLRKENIPRSERTNVFSGPRLPARADRPIT